MTRRKRRRASSTKPVFTVRVESHDEADRTNLEAQPPTSGLYDVADAVLVVTMAVDDDGDIVFNFASQGPDKDHMMSTKHVCGAWLCLAGVLNESLSAGPAQDLCWLATSLMEGASDPEEVNRIVAVLSLARTALSGSAQRKTP